MTPQQTASRDPAERAARRRVLLVDDHGDSRRLLGIMLSLVGHEVIETGNGTEALRLALSEQPDVAVVDIGLPGMDGYEVARRIREHPDTSGMVLIALTGYGHEEDQRCALAAGFDLHLVKPVESARLDEAIVQSSRRTAR